MFSRLHFTYSNNGIVAAASLPLFDPRIVNGEDAELGEIPYQVHVVETYIH